ncbi:FadR family transcriptional regulator [Pedobacter sp. BS3]|uniref:FadR/GntR family transcriptional regulator n=1 Tax=Pedobacter sp. BS3 TaxID=2567937 RepID=UPI0011EEBC16|nr:FadR/GntR family transcriptional regulator [Pedobacter sp. BS3]TZF84846.1 FadR family transcriptional regulator [Pedobacter sp. BS3]
MMNENLTITRRSLADEVAAKLQQQISLGKYKVNDKLPIEPELMKTYGVGRSTIREAIKILTNSGLLRVQQGVGTFVESTSGNQEPLIQRLKRADKPDLDEVRQILEMKIAEKAALNRTEADIEKIKSLLEQRKQSAKAGSLEACIDADIRFHTAIAEASGNDILADLYRSVAIHLRNWFISIYKDTQAFSETEKLHEQLLKSIIEGNAAKAWQNASKIIGHRPG